MSLSISSLLSSYTYQTTTLRPKIDKDADSQWSQTELESYTPTKRQLTKKSRDTGFVSGLPAFLLPFTVSHM